MNEKVGNFAEKTDLIFWQMTCVEHLCDTLCYQLDLASFVACVNSGQPWNSKFSLMLSGKEQLEFRDEDTYSDPFVENFVLERLSVQSPLRVILYVKWMAIVSVCLEFLPFFGRATIVYKKLLM